MIHIFHSLSLSTEEIGGSKNKQMLISITFKGELRFLACLYSQSLVLLALRGDFEHDSLPLTECPLMSLNCGLLSKGALCRVHPCCSQSTFKTLPTFWTVWRTCLAGNYFNRKSQGLPEKNFSIMPLFQKHFEICFNGDNFKVKNDCWRYRKQIVQIMFV